MLHVGYITHTIPLRRYEAACALREALRGRAVLLLVDRTDIATAAEADGVLLTDFGTGGTSCEG